MRYQRERNRIIHRYCQGCRKLRGARNVYRLRVGDYRILYVLLAKGEILVFKIAEREVAYR